jgi:hypothetical protein
MTTMMIMMMSVMIFGNHCDVAQDVVSTASVTISGDKVSCGNSIWWKLVTEKQDVWPFMSDTLPLKSIL